MHVSCVFLINTNIISAKGKLGVKGSEENERQNAGRGETITLSTEVAAAACRLLCFALSHLLSMQPRCDGLLLLAQASQGVV